MDINRINSRLDGPLAAQHLAADSYLDTNGDGNLSSIDALLVIHYINIHPDGEGEAAAASPEPIDAINPSAQAASASWDWWRSKTWSKQPAADAAHDSSQNAMSAAKKTRHSALR